MSVILEVEGLSKAFGPVVAARDVDLRLRRGEIQALVGENGAGKTTVVKCVAGVLAPDAGRMRIRGRPLGRTPAEVLRQGVAVVWQDLALCENLGVVENLFLGRELGRGWLDEAEMRRQTAELVEELGLPIPDLSAPVRRLSGGQRQLVAFARALLERPSVLMLDEPTAALGFNETRIVEGLIRRLAGSGIAVLLVSHQLDQVFRLADRIAVMRHGEIVTDVARTEVHPDDVAALLSGARVDTTASQQLRRLQSLVDQLAEADPSVVLPLTVSAMANALATDMLCVFLADRSTPDRPRLVRSAAMGIPDPLLEATEVLELGPAGGSVGQAAATGQVVVVDDVRTDPLWQPFHEAAWASNILSTWAAPIIGVDGLIGVVAGYASSVGGPSTDQLELVRLFTNLAATAIERANLLTELQRRNRVLGTLRTLLETLAGPEPVRGGIGVALLALCRGLGSDAAALYVRGDDGPPECLTTMYPSPGSAEASTGARRLAEVAEEVSRRRGGAGARWGGPDVAVCDFDSPLGRSLLAVYWHDPDRATPDALDILADAANSLRLALEREQLVDARQEAAALRRSAELQRSFMSRLSHELRTPLTAIQGYATTLLSRDVTWAEDERQRFLEAIAAESRRLGRLVADLLDSSAIEAGILRLQPDWCDLALVVERAASCVPGAEETVRIDVADELEPVWADHDRLEQVFVNLIANAIRHNPPGTRVGVTLMRGVIDGTIAVRIADDGRGLPPSVARWLMDGQVDDPAVAGLGLKIARGIVEAHGGRLLVEQTRGASLLAVIPVHPADLHPEGRGGG